MQLPWLSIQLQVKGLITKAVAYYQYAVVIDPTCPIGYFYRAVAYDIMRDYQRALKDFTAAVRYNVRSGDLDQGLILFNRSVIASKLGMDHYALADLNKALALYVPLVCL